MSKKIFGRALGAGFALATATALVVPGIASAEESEDSGSLSSISAGSLDMDFFECILDSGSAGAEEEPADEEEATGSLDFGSILECFTGGSNGDDDGDNGDD